ncbi:hypothetical protein GWO43_02410 [candidate division KSB1 bacterium]|nr:hypothetical protein [candidate division KSB1 bacterium]NIR69718.1 hypothetical protein [candidate division KSB1 bacterium]NIT69763.1 hypothetical protein [candidate division KSB1 bacterium]NIX69444.1 hypothetical protein [candidate division KSB1 bacterium]
MRPITQIILLVLFVCLGIINCSDNPVEFKSEEIEGKVSKNKLTISNKIDKPNYYFVVERESAVHINWAPISNDENKINPQQNKQLDLNDVYGFQDGKQIIIYYWSVVDPDAQAIKNIVVDTK